jgi:hypothetical protein
VETKEKGERRKLGQKAEASVGPIKTSKTLHQSEQQDINPIRRSHGSSK